MYLLKKPGQWPSQHLHLKINSGFHASKNPKQQNLKVVTFSDASFSKKRFHSAKRARSLVVSDLHSETKGSWVAPGCYLCAEVSPLH